MNGNERKNNGTRRLRIVSANLLNGGADPQAFAELVATLGADVVAVQEVEARQAHALAAVLPYGDLAPASDHTGMGIALRRPAPVRRIPLPCRDAHVVRLTPQEWPILVESLEVVNVHIAAPHIPPFWPALHRRRGQLSRLEEYLDRAAQCARVVIGDFNSPPWWPLYRRLAARLTDAAVVAAARRGVRPQATWGPNPSGTRLLRLDHALVTGAAVEDFRVVPVAGSDHSAIVLDLSNPENGLEAERIGPQ